MKNALLLLTVLVLLLPFAPGWGAESDRAPVDVLVRVQGKLDIRLHQGTPSEIKALLQAEAENAQRDLITFLDGIKGRTPLKYRSLWIINAIALSAPMEVIRQLNDRPDVLEILPDQIINLPPVQEGKERGIEGEAHWNIKLVNAPEVWKKYGLRGQGVRIGHIDSGADGDHADLKGKIYAWRDFIESSSSPNDGNGHGTHSLGTIIGGNASGAYIGVAPEARAAVAKVFSASGSTSTSALLGAMEWVMDPDNDPTTDDAPRVVSNSWGSSSVDRTFRDAVAAWVQAGIFPCFAAGNGGPSARTVGTPGGLPHAFAVGATTSSDSIAYFSSRGPVRWDEGEIIKPEVSAPGQDIKSCLPGGSWGSKSGTSMACPNVAGAIALLYQAEPNLTVQDVWRALEESAVDLGDTGRDNTFGCGRIDILKAVENVLLGGTLAGTLTDAQGKPLAGVRVHVAGVLDLKTGVDGSFSAMLKEGDWKVQLDAFGYRPEEFTVKVVRKRTTDISRRLRPAPRVTLQGTVKDKAGKPLAATVSIVGIDTASIQADGNSGAYRLELPAGDYTVRFQCFQYATREYPIKLATGGARIDAVLERLPPVLLVADAKDDVSKWYKEALDACNTGYTLLAGGDAADLNTLLQYPLVIWCTGRDSSNTLTSSNQAALTEYLKGGGHLMLSGQDIGYNIKSTDFYREVLQAKYLADSAKAKIVKGQDSPFAGLNFSITGGTGADNQTYPDAIEALAPAKRVLTYDDAANNGAAVLNASGNALYLGFGFEGIATAEHRKAVLQATLDLLLPGGRERAGRLSTMPASTPADVRTAIAERLLLDLEAELDAGRRERLSELIDECRTHPQACAELAASLKALLLSRGAEAFAAELEALDARE